MPSPHPTQRRRSGMLISRLVVALAVLLALWYMLNGPRQTVLAPSDLPASTSGAIALPSDLPASTSGAIALPATASSATEIPVQPQIAAITGISAGQQVHGTVTITANVTGQHINRVIFTVHGPIQLTHVATGAPYALLGHRGDSIRGWDTTGYPDGRYTLSVTALTESGQTAVASIDFTVANAPPPAPISAASVPTETVTISIDRTSPLMRSQLDTGVTHTQYSLDTPHADDAAVASARAILAASVHYQNQHIMGWGVGNPEPAPGSYHWDDLDSRMAMIRSMGSTAVLTLCCAPDWMKGGQTGQTDWSRLDVAPTPDHYDDFAELARQIALRYPDVHYYQVWNEMKGFWDPGANNWDYAAYTRFYNKIYDALKAVNPAIKVGGPYLVIEGTGSNRGDWTSDAPIRPRQWAVLDYWLANKHGADFICLDRATQDAHDTNTYSVTELFNLTQEFGSIAHQIRIKTNLPIWWSEYYAIGPAEATPALHATVLEHMLMSGAAVALLWNPMDTGEVNHFLYSDVRQPGGGRPVANTPVEQIFHNDFGPGTQIYRALASSPDVQVLAGARTTLLINTRATPVMAQVNGVPQPLQGYEVRLLDMP